jgi:acetyltransferase-like isoleucine patch superfamily enzyme
MLSKFATIETQWIGEGTSISDYAIVRAGSRLGRGVVIHPHVVIASGVILEDGVEVFPGAVIGREPNGAGATSRSPMFNRAVHIGSYTSIGPNAVIYFDVEIGEHTLIGDGASIREQCRIGRYCIISRYVTVNYNATIGDRTKIMDLTHITGNCTIGNDVFISTLVASVNDNSLGDRAYDSNEVIGPDIRDGARIGAGAILLPGIVIGERAVVGSGSVVTKSVAAETLVIGTPARFVRSVRIADTSKIEKDI